MQRFRVISVWALVLLLAVGIDPMGRAVASVAVTGQQAPAAVMNIAGTGGGCGVCRISDHAAMPPSGCATGICWNLPASSDSNLLSELYASRAPFGLETYNLAAGVSGGPEP